MQWIKKRLVLLSLILLVYGAYTFVHIPVTPKQPAVLGTTTNLVLYTQPQTGRQFLLDGIEQAKKEILVEVYLFSDKQLLSALMQAKNRGVTVGVMLEEHPYGGGNLNQKTSELLKQNGITVMWTNPFFTLTHEKAVIIDGKELYVLSQNLTTASFEKNREYDVVDITPGDVQEARDMFRADWDRQSATLPAQTDLVVSPVNARTSLETLIQGAVVSIDIEIEEINDPVVVSLLAEKAKHMSVLLLAPTLSQIASNNNALQKLQQAGVQVKTEQSPYIHAKLILVDNKKAYVGSVNLSTQSMDNNRELGILLAQQDIVQNLLSTFTTDWNNAEPLH